MSDLRAGQPTTDPCWCWGPWQKVDPADRPDTTLGRQHRRGSAGCDYPTETAEPTLDAAWAEAEAALPEGWSIWWLRNDHHIEGGWDACAGWDAASNPAEARVASGSGQTPAAALRALAARLHERTVR